MPSSYYILLFVAVVAALAAVAWKWLRLRNAIRSIDEAVRSGSVAGINAATKDEALPPWVNALGNSLVKRLDEQDRLRRDVAFKERFRILLNEVSIGFFVVNRDLEIQFANKALNRFFPIHGSGEEKLLIEVLLDHRLVNVVREAIKSRARTSREINVEGTRAEENDPGDRVFEIEAAPLPDDPEAGCWVMIRDITESVMTEQVRKDFVANASHELRTPLTLINGYIETLEDGLIDDRDAALRSLAVMRKHGRRLVRIIEDMLTISKLESAAGSLRPEPFDLRECVKDVADHLASLVEEKRAVIELDFPEGSHTMLGDRFYWDQVFMNLIENALKQNHRPGLQVTISYRNDGRNYIIKVIDDGVGIARADLPYIFKRFFRAARHHSQDVQGTGLGLSIVKRAVEGHGGKISADSKPGVKTVFTITVPVIAVDRWEQPELLMTGSESTTSA